MIEWSIYFRKWETISIFPKCRKKPGSLSPSEKHQSLCRTILIQAILSVRKGRERVCVCVCVREREGDIHRNTWMHLPIQHDLPFSPSLIHTQTHTPILSLTHACTHTRTHGVNNYFSCGCINTVYHSFLPCRLLLARILCYRWWKGFFRSDVKRDFFTGKKNFQTHFYFLPLIGNALDWAFMIMLLFWKNWWHVALRDSSYKALFFLKTCEVCTLSFSYYIEPHLLDNWWLWCCYF